MDKFEWKASIDYQWLSNHCCVDISENMQFPSIKDFPNKPLVFQGSGFFSILAPNAVIYRCFSVRSVSKTSTI
jgi:hypothetical protein